LINVSKKVRKELAYRCHDIGFESVSTEVPIQVPYKDLCRIYFDYDKIEVTTNFFNYFAINYFAIYIILGDDSIATQMNLLCPTNAPRAGRTF
jgi:hypothetical protein